jgi:hypothetical protein
MSSACGPESTEHVSDAACCAAGARLTAWASLLRRRSVCACAGVPVAALGTGDGAAARFFGAMLRTWRCEGWGWWWCGAEARCIAATAAALYSTAARVIASRVRASAAR